MPHRAAGAAPAPAPALRADAAHNRLRVLRAAREVFAERGLDAPVAAVARRAGVGVATLYRRFPTRDALLAEVFADEMAACTGAVEDALADPDPWRGFSAFLELVCAAQATDRGFTAALLTTATAGGSAFEDSRARMEEKVAAVVRRAKAAGALRPDFSRADLSLALMANRGITAESPEAAAAASRRLVALLLRSFRAGAPEPDPLPPVAAVGLYPARATPGAPPPRR
ncbi:TetR/AcrR family transcriptional regulator [Streptomonospora sp. S1-112]|uniref:TetR/AcrR family transcriptional regulator n=1 Tax=Streptomonospora mangrovi TaxID=2883123 RepID=A0A9X3NH55_9ACTN|nr:helix-turn-helix domain-containing protein [Streptomonospora mangrovi]MDA0563372.1 TetR/AcrR family transcriptional regulator [Streptomonospora mangrovi]